MQGDALVPGPAGQLDQLFPGRQLAANLALRQLEQESAQGFAHPLKLVQLHQPVGVPDQDAVEVMELLVALLFVDLQVAFRMEGHIPGSPPVRPDPQGNLLGHRPARHKDRRLLAQQISATSRSKLSISSPSP